MRVLRADAAGVSEVVGALMLVLIVVGAATALSVFVNQYQKQLQAEQAVQQQRTLESLKVLRVVPSVAANGSMFSLNLTLASLHTTDSAVTQLYIDDATVLDYTADVLNLSTGKLEADTIAIGGRLVVAAEQQVNVVINMSSSFHTYQRILTSDFVKVEILTALENDFAQVFEPPSAIALVSTVSLANGTGYIPFVTLDGSASTQPGDGFLVSWTWTVTNVTNPKNPFTWVLSGEKVRANLTARSAFVVDLTVQNDFGLIGTDSLTYFT